MKSILGYAAALHYLRSAEVANKVANILKEPGTDNVFLSESTPPLGQLSLQQP